MAEILKAKCMALYSGRLSGPRLALRIFRRADRNRSGGVDREELKMLFKDITDYQLDSIFNECDLNQDALLDKDELVRVLRGDMTKTREDIIRLVFEAADADKDGLVTIEDLRMIADFSTRKSVVEGETTEEQLFRDFLEDFEPDPRIRDGKVTLEEFIDYYSIQSGYYRSDYAFRLFINSQWRVDAIKEVVSYSHPR